MLFTRHQAPRLAIDHRLEQGLRCGLKLGHPPAVARTADDTSDDVYTLGVMLNYLPGVRDSLDDEWAFPWRQRTGPLRQHMLTRHSGLTAAEYARHHDHDPGWRRSDAAAVIGLPRTVGRSGEHPGEDFFRIQIRRPWPDDIDATVAVDVDDLWPGLLDQP